MTVKTEEKMNKEENKEGEDRRERGVEGEDGGEIAYTLHSGGRHKIQ